MSEVGSKHDPFPLFRGIGRQVFDALLQPRSQVFAGPVPGSTNRLVLPNTSHSSGSAVTYCEVSSGLVWSIRYREPCGAPEQKLKSSKFRLAPIHDDIAIYCQSCRPREHAPRSGHSDCCRCATIVPLAWSACVATTSARSSSAYPVSVPLRRTCHDNADDRVSKPGSSDAMI